MALAEGLGGHLGVTLSEQVFRNQSLDMASVSGGALNCYLVSGSSNPSLGIFRPISKHFLVNFISRRLLLAVNS